MVLWKKFQGNSYPNYSDSIAMQSCIMRWSDSEVSNLGPVVQSIVSLMSSLVVKMLNVLVSTISKSGIFAVKM